MAVLMAEKISFHPTAVNTANVFNKDEWMSKLDLRYESLIVRQFQTFLINKMTGTVCQI